MSTNNIFEAFDAIQTTIINAHSDEPGNQSPGKTKSQAPGAEISSSSKQLALERELEQLTAVNSTMSSVLESIGSTKSNLTTLLQATNQTNSLLELWIKILNQANFNQELINDTTWQGSSSSETKWQDRVGKLNDVMNKIDAEKRKREQEVNAKQNSEKVRQQRFNDKQELLRRRVYGRGGASSSQAREEGSGNGGRISKDRAWPTSRK